MFSFKKNFFGQMHNSRPKNGGLSQLSITVGNFFEILQNQRAQEVHQNYIIGFSEESSFRAIGPFWVEK